MVASEFHNIWKIFIYYIFIFKNGDIEETMEV